MGVGPVSLVNRLLNEIGGSLKIVFGESEDGSRLSDYHCQEGWEVENRTQEFGLFLE